MIRSVVVGKLGVGDRWVDRYRWKGKVSTSTVIALKSNFLARRRFYRRLKSLAAAMDVDVDVRHYRGFLHNEYLIYICGPEKGVKSYVRTLRS